MSVPVHGLDRPTGGDREGLQPSKEFEGQPWRTLPVGWMGPHFCHLVVRWVVQSVLHTGALAEEWVRVWAKADNRGGVGVLPADLISFG